MNQDTIDQLKYLYADPGVDGFDTLDTSMPAPQGWEMSQPVDLIGASDQMPFDTSNMMQSSPQVTSQKIQELLGAKQPSSGGIAQDILASRFGGGPDLADYGKGFAESSFGKPTLGADVASAGMNEQLKQMQMLQAIDTGAAHADLYRKGGTGTNGATMQVIQGLMNANPGMTFDQALYQYQTGNRSGTYLSPDKSIGMTPGKANALQNTANATTTGSETAKTDLERQGNYTKAQSSLVTLGQQQKLLGNAVDQGIALATTSKNATGWGNLATGFAPNTDARKLNNLIQQIRSSNIVDTLQQMRDNSKTGGALGNVSNYEDAMLGAIRGVLDPLQSDQLVQNLNTIKKYLPLVAQERTRAFQQDYGTTQPFGNNPQPIKKSAVQLDETDPRVQKAREHGYTDEEIAAHLQGGQ